MNLRSEIKRLRSSLDFWNGRNVHFCRDITVTGLCRILNAEMKALAQKSIDIHTKKANVVSREQDDIVEKG